MERREYERLREHEAGYWWHVARRDMIHALLEEHVPRDPARKALDMFAKTGVAVLGMIENMSTHICSQCGHEEHLFGHGGVAAEAEKLGAPLLAEIPLHLDIRTAGDGGAPVVVARPESREAEVFKAMARRLVEGGYA